ncbi:MAG: hypothetical protein ACR2HO_01585 [Rubrobacteraceae bacterium]|nr:hypothetical protein [Rubrobacter sp.]
MSDLERVARILREVADKLGECTLKEEIWGIDYVWALPNDQIFVSDAGKPEVLVTQMSDELRFLEDDFDEGSHALPYMLSKVGDLLRGCEAAISISADRTDPSDD